MRFAAAATFAFLIFSAPSASLLAQTRPQTIESTITLPNRNTARPPTGSIAGTVVSETTGLPLAGATVTISHHRESAVIALLSGEEPGPLVRPVTTDERGRFLFQRVAAGSYELTARMDGYLGDRSGETANTRAPKLRLASDERVDNIKMSLIRSSRIEGRVRTETGQPAARVPVGLIQSGPMNRIAQATTSDDGSYRLDGFPTGDYILIAGSPMVPEGEPARSFARPIAITTSDTVSLDFSLDTKSYGIHGKLTLDLANVPPASMDMTILAMAAMENSPGPVTLPINILYSATTGAYDIPRLYPGLYRITASSTDPRAEGHCAAEDVVVQRADVENLDMILMGCGKQ